MASIVLRPLSPVRKTLVPVRRENIRSRADLPVVQDRQITDPDRIEPRFRDDPLRVVAAAIADLRPPSYCGVLICFWYLAYSCPYPCCGVMSGAGSIAPLILNLSNREESSALRSADFTPLKGPSGPHIRSRRFGYQQNLKCRAIFCIGIG